MIQLALILLLSALASSCGGDDPAPSQNNDPCATCAPPEICTDDRCQLPQDTTSNATTVNNTTNHTTNTTSTTTSPPGCQDTLTITLNAPWLPQPLPLEAALRTPNRPTRQVTINPDADGLYRLTTLRGAVMLRIQDRWIARWFPL